MPSRFGHALAPQARRLPAAREGVSLRHALGRWSVIMELRQGESAARSQAQRGSEHHEVLARSGLVAKGVSFAIVGALALKLALIDGGKATSRQGALRMIARQPGSWRSPARGRLRGVRALALRRGVGDEDSRSAKEWGKRIGGSSRRGVIYASLAGSVSILLGSGGGGSQDKKAHQTTATVLVARRDVDRRARRCRDRGRRALERVSRRDAEVREEVAQRRHGRGCAAVRQPGHWRSHLARCVVFGIIGWFVVQAALDYKPKDAIGLDRAAKLAHASYGPLLLGVLPRRG